ncbi:MAG TPA: pilus assembly protein TadG-related protein [Nocardioidaceae bacterium]|nr:pilus assembly protein TadG-related protein [Nocardioidaceae bacterium]
MVAEVVWRRHGVPSRRRGQRGQSALLILGFFLVAVMLVGVVVDASAAYLRRQALNGLADGAALAAADGVQGEQVYTGGLGETAQVDPVAARAYVAEYLAQTRAHQRFDGLVYRVLPAGDSVTVHLSAPLDLPIPPPGWVGDPWIDGVASAVVAVG